MLTLSPETGTKTDPVSVAPACNDSALYPTIIRESENPLFAHHAFKSRVEK